MTSADPSAARRYHERTKHSFQSVRASPHFLDWDIMPRPFKVYPDLEPISLPRDVTTSTRPALAATADPGTATGTGPRLDRAALARLFYFSAGVLRRTTYPGGEMFYRAAACTGALYHIDLYLACGPLPDLDPGVYHFGPHDFALRRLRAGDHREAVIGATGREPAAAAAPAPLGLAPLRLSAREVDYPAIREAHAASCLATAEEAAVWHGAAPRPAPAPAESAVSLAPLDTDAIPEPIETVIRRRGSMRD